MAPSGLTELSVFRIDDLSEDEIWLVGDEMVPHPGTEDRNYRADLAVSAVREAQLDVMADTEPHPKHANITGLPTKREEQIDVAKRLMEMAKLRTRSA